MCYLVISPSFLLSCYLSFFLLFVVASVWLCVFIGGQDNVRSLLRASQCFTLCWIQVESL